MMAFTRKKKLFEMVELRKGSLVSTSMNIEVILDSKLIFQLHLGKQPTKLQNPFKHLGERLIEIRVFLIPSNNCLGH